MPIQAGTPSVAGPATLPSMSVSALNLTADHTKLIFNLVYEGRHLKERVAREFARLSSKEVLFCTQAQSTSHESLASGHPDRFSMYYEIFRSNRESLDAKDKATEEILNKVSEAWLQTNASLFKHILDYEGKLNTFLDKAGGWIREQEEQIWTMMFQNNRGHWSAIMCQPRHFAPSPGNTPLISGKRCIPEPVTHHLRVCAQSLWSALVRASQPESSSHSFDSRRKAEDILKEAIICSTGGGVAATVRTDPSASTSTAPTQISRDAETLPWVVLPPVLPLLYALLPSANTPSPLLHSAHSPAPPLLARVQHPSVDQEGVVRAH